MSEEPEIWSLGEVYNRQAVDRVLVHTAWSLREELVHAIASWESVLGTNTAGLDRKYDELVTLLLSSALMMLAQLPKGVGILAPAAEYRVACGFERPFVITLDPLDGFEWLKQRPFTALDAPDGGIFVSFAAIDGDDVIGAYAIDLITGKLFRVRPQDDEGRVVMSMDRYGAGVVPLAASDIHGLTARNTLILQGMQPEPHSELLGCLGGLDFRHIEPNAKARVRNLLQVAGGDACAYFRPAGDSTARWIELPLRMFARAAGVRQFQLRDGGLYEVSLADPPMEWGDKTPDLSLGGLTHGMLYVGDRYVTELSSLIPMHPLS